MIQKSYDGSPTLYIVPTPIGNLEDITIRALNILKEVDVIFAEDTRTTKQLLNHFDINNKLISSHLYNENQNEEKELNYLKDGKNIAVVSDRGTPVISDPGYILVRNAIEHGYNVVCLPGPTAVIPALVMSGLSGGPFTFYGFLSLNKKLRTKELEQIRSNRNTIILYEAPHKIVNTLKDLENYVGDRKVVLARELTKIHEECSRGTLREMIEKFEQPKGEFVIMLDLNSNIKEKEETNLTVDELYEMYLKQGLDKREIIKKIAKDKKVAKNEIYQYFIDRK